MGIVTSQIRVYTKDVSDGIIEQVIHERPYKTQRQGKSDISPKVNTVKAKNGKKYIAINHKW